MVFAPPPTVRNDFVDNNYEYERYDVMDEKEGKGFINARSSIVREDMEDTIMLKLPDYESSSSSSSSSGDSDEEDMKLPASASKKRPIRRAIENSSDSDCDKNEFYSFDRKTTEVSSNQIVDLYDTDNDEVIEKPYPSTVYDGMYAKHESRNQNKKIRSPPMSSQKKTKMNLELDEDEIETFSSDDEEMIAASKTFGGGNAVLKSSPVMKRRRSDISYSSKENVVNDAIIHPFFSRQAISKKKNMNKSNSISKRGQKGTKDQIVINLLDEGLNGNNCSNTLGTSAVSQKRGLVQKPSLLEHSMFSSRSQNFERNDLIGGSGVGINAFQVHREIDTEASTAANTKQNRGKKGVKRSGGGKSGRSYSSKKTRFWKGKGRGKKRAKGRPTSKTSAWSGREGGFGNSSGNYTGIARSDALGDIGGANISF